MEAFYLDIRGIHIGAVILSGSLFLIRVVGHNLLEAQWPMASPLRFLVWSVDTILLTAALMLMTIVQQYPFVDHWLTVKVVLLVVYIGLGTQAFSLKRSRRTRIGFWLAALLVFGFIVTVARAHDPLGLFAGLVA